MSINRNFALFILLLLAVSLVPSQERSSEAKPGESAQLKVLDDFESPSSARLWAGSFEYSQQFAS
ncbi:MAG: hypothetical protein L0338_30505, partial [Acidobacteria bacterium]|nr:hypothetical protein [Acidobacteriota bacterium]